MCLRITVTLSLGCTLGYTCPFCNVEHGVLLCPLIKNMKPWECMNLMGKQRRGSRQLSSWNADTVFRQPPLLLLLSWEFGPKQPFATSYIFFRTDLLDIFKCGWVKCNVLFANVVVNVHSDCLNQLQIHMYIYFLASVMAADCPAPWPARPHRQMILYWILAVNINIG